MIDNKKRPIDKKLDDIGMIKALVVRHIKYDKDYETFEYHGVRYSVEVGCVGVWEIMINKKYFISIGKQDDGTWEVFTLHYNKVTKTTWEDWSHIPVNEDFLCQHRVFKSLKCAFNYALKAAQNGRTPIDVKEIW